MPENRTHFYTPVAVSLALVCLRMDYGTVVAHRKQIASSSDTRSQVRQVQQVRQKASTVLKEECGRSSRNSTLSLLYYLSIQCQACHRSPYRPRGQEAIPP